ncbi:MAG: decarboxylase [Halioglobus sp.]|nr:decarboxylase [Halioglobus sp.]
MLSEVYEKGAVQALGASRSSFQKAIQSVLTVGRELLAKQRSGGAPAHGTATSLTERCMELLEHRGEASGLALAEEIAAEYQLLGEDEKRLFLLSLAAEFDVDTQQILDCAAQYREDPNHENLERVAHAVEAPRKKLFRRINMAPDGTRTLVALRGDLLRLLPEEPELRSVEADLKHLFAYWFNKGFLELRQIDWNSPAAVLEKLIAYEAVHAISGWEDLRGRLRRDRRCFAFFHPAMGDDPIVFVEVALTTHTPEAIGPLISLEREPLDPGEATTVVFYSISNCHPGLNGISFGNFLIKNVVKLLSDEFSSLRTFLTLSPIPGFRRWLTNTDLTKLIGDEAMAEKVRAPLGQVVETDVRDALLRLCAHYLLNVKSRGLARDPVARFHLSNGASLHKLHWGADLTLGGRSQSAGMMVNYLYEVQKIEVNHEAYFNQQKISASKEIARLVEQRK